MENSTVSRQAILVILSGTYIRFSNSIPENVPSLTFRDSAPPLPDIFEISILSFVPKSEDVPKFPTLKEMSCF